MIQEYWVYIVVLDAVYYLFDCKINKKYGQQVADDFQNIIDTTIELHLAVLHALSAGNKDCGGAQYRKSFRNSS